MNENVLVLELISIFFSESLKVNWFEIESPTGSFAVYTGHSPITSLIKKKSTLSYQLLDGTTHNKEIEGGLLVLTKKSAIIFID